jgi:polysaccharide chain length determinant protein (PEP-CTERM system associated)
MDQLLEEIVDQLHGIWLRRFWGLAVAWVVGIAGLAVAFVVPLQYEAAARVFVDTDSVLKPLMAGLAVQPNVDQQVAMLASTLLSRPNVEKLVQVADLDPDGKTGKDQNALIQRVTRAVQLTGSTKDNLFSLSYRDTDPTRAKRTVESLLSMFVESGLSNKRRDTDNARAFLDAQIKQYEAVLDESERRLKDFKLQNLDHLAAAQDQVGNMLAVDREIEKARSELRAAEQRRDALRKQLDSERPMFRREPWMADRTPGQSHVTDPISDIDSRADVLRRNLDELLRKFTDDHPDVVGTRRILADLEKQREVLVEAKRRFGVGGRASREQSRIPADQSGVGRCRGQRSRTPSHAV